ncbi:hypothetical protein KC842_03275, partial [Candidatus Nomurabacteria bacterium]|nr:hypothetical protein [Candidatus Nomurabacteria bacterium]
MKNTDVAKRKRTFFSLLFILTLLVAVALAIPLSNTYYQKERELFKGDTKVSNSFGEEEKYLEYLFLDDSKKQGESEYHNSSSQITFSGELKKSARCDLYIKKDNELYWQEGIASLTYSISTNLCLEGTYDVELRCCTQNNECESRFLSYTQTNNSCSYTLTGLPQGGEIRDPNLQVKLMTTQLIKNCSLLLETQEETSQFPLALVYDKEKQEYLCVGSLHLEEESPYAYQLLLNGEARNETQTFTYKKETRETKNSSSQEKEPYFERNTSKENVSGLTLFKGSANTGTYKLLIISEGTSEETRAFLETNFGNGDHSLFKTRPFKDQEEKISLFYELIEAYSYKLGSCRLAQERKAENESRFESVVQKYPQMDAVIYLSKDPKVWANVEIPTTMRISFLCEDQTKTPQIVIHEFGHLFAQLYDEYRYAEQRELQWGNRNCCEGSDEECREYFYSLGLEEYAGELYASCSENKYKKATADSIMDSYPLGKWEDIWGPVNEY